MLITMVTILGCFSLTHGHESEFRTMRRRLTRGEKSHPNSVWMQKGQRIYWKCDNYGCAWHPVTKLECRKTSVPSPQPSPDWFYLNGFKPVDPKRLEHRGRYQPASSENIAETETVPSK